MLIRYFAKAQIFKFLFYECFVLKTIAISAVSHLLRYVKSFAAHYLRSAVHMPQKASAY